MSQPRTFTYLFPCTFTWDTDYSDTNLSFLSVESWLLNTETKEKPFYLTCRYAWLQQIVAQRRYVTLPLCHSVRGTCGELYR